MVAIIALFSVKRCVEDADESLKIISKTIWIGVILFVILIKGVVFEYLANKYKEEIQYADGWKEQFTIIKKIKEESFAKEENQSEE